MSARARGWLAALVAVALLGGLAVLGGVPARVGVPGAGDGGPGDGLVAGRPAPPRTDLPEPGEVPRGGQERDRAVRDLLDRRATALRQRDEAAFLTTIDPLASADFVAAQRALFTNLGGVPLSEWSYRVDGSSPATPPRRADAGELWAPRTTLRYALEGVDTVPTERPMGYLYARRDGRWYLTSDTELGPDGERTWRGPWDFGPCVAVAAPGGLVVGHAGQEELLTRLAAELDAAVLAVTEVWGTEWSQQVAVIVPAGTEELRELVGPAFAVDGIAAAAVADLVDVANHTAIGQRVVLNPTQIGRLSTAARRIVLRHEITHIAARAATVDGAPMWLLEGFADYVGYRDSGLRPREAAPDLVRVMRTRGVPDTLPADTDFTGGSTDLDLAYQLGWSAALHVVELAGEDGLVRLYRLVAGGPDPTPAAVDAALLQVLGTDLAGFVASWRQSLTQHFS
ncbi:MAG TPA: hypothetical protein VGD67_00230 [Pseudonocardiaceae bacterium]